MAHGPAELQPPQGHPADHAGDGHDHPDRGPSEDGPEDDDSGTDGVHAARAAGDVEGHVGAHAKVQGTVDDDRRATVHPLAHRHRLGRSHPSGWTYR